MYKFPLIKTEAEKEQEMNLIASQQVVSAKQQSRVRQVTHDLVQWAEQLVSAATHDKIKLRREGCQPLHHNA